MAEIVNEAREEVNIKAGVVLEATLWSIPALSQKGIKIGAPPIAKVAPKTPALKPAPISFFLFPSFIGIVCILIISGSLRSEIVPSCLSISIHLNILWVIA